MASIQNVVDFNNKVACNNCSLQQLCLPLGVNRQDLQQLDDIIRRRRPIPRGQHVFMGGDPFHSLFAIRSGSIKTYLLTEAGGEQITGFYLPGELVGLDAIDGGLHPCSARALETSGLCEIPFDMLEVVVEKIPGLARQLMRLMSREIQADEHLLTLLGKRTAEERVAAFLINLSTRFKERGFSHHEFLLSMSRIDIGNYLGLAVETVSRIFTRFQNQGFVLIDHKHVKLTNELALRQLAGWQSDHATELTAHR